MLCLIDDNLELGTPGLRCLCLHANCEIDISVEFLCCSLRELKRARDSHSESEQNQGSLASALVRTIFRGVGQSTGRRSRLQDFSTSRGAPRGVNPFFYS